MFFLTTAIDYTNGAPHIGHAYEKVLADVIARWHRARGESVFFLTGVDQHGQKVQQSAERAGQTPAEFVAEKTAGFVELCQQLGLSHDGWAATTDPRHVACVQLLLQKLHNAGQLYKKSYRGFYSVRQEQFLTDKERNGAGEFGPEWGEVAELEEENWYFRLSDHVEWLEQFLDKHPGHVSPANRLADVKNALAKSRGTDLSISRPKSRLSWGIELPFDADCVCYVWFDALVNYLSFAGHLADETGAENLPDFAETWPQTDAANRSLHIIGKDILVPPHGIYWPCMLHAAGFTDDQIPPLLVHGWWNLKAASGGSEKMSKSLGNVVDPFVLIDQFGLDALRYFLAREIVTGKDADFDVQRLIVLHNSELANDFGNLTNRTLNMLGRFAGGSIDWQSGSDVACEALEQTLQNGIAKFAELMERHALSEALVTLNELVKAANRFIEEKAPWALAKVAAEDPEKAAELRRSLSLLAEVVIQLAARYAPFLPETCAKLAAQFGVESLPSLSPATSADWSRFLADGHRVGQPQPLFPRLELPAPTGAD